MSLCSSMGINAVMYEKGQECEAVGISLKYSIDRDISGTVKEIDICSIVFNLLDNAIEACVNKGGGIISFDLHRVGEYPVFRTENPWDSPKPVTGCREVRGWGLVIIFGLARKYKGNSLRKITDGKYIHIVNIYCG